MEGPMDGLPGEGALYCGSREQSCPTVGARHLLKSPRVLPEVAVFLFPRGLLAPAGRFRCTESEFHEKVLSIDQVWCT